MLVSSIRRSICFGLFFVLGISSLSENAYGAYTAIYGADGNDFYQFTGACSVANLKGDCWNGLIMFALTVQPNGDLTVASGSETLATNGTYTGDPTWGPNVSALKAAPTSVTRYELCLGGWGDTSYANIQALVASQGTGPGSILYRNFKALKQACPGLDAINDDDEGNYDLNSTVAFGWMLNALGMKLSQAPYMNQGFWVALKNSLGGVCDMVYLQCYQGGAGNSPAQWDAAFGGGFHVIPGQETNFASQPQFAAWAATGSTGGFFWPDWYWGPGSDWSSLIAAGIGTNCATAPALTPYLNVNGAGWQALSSASVPYNASVSLGPQSSQGAWAWTGPGGYSASTRQVDQIPLQPGLNTFVATNTTSCVCATTLTFSITMAGPPACSAGASVGNAGAPVGGYNLAGQLDCNRVTLAQPMTATSLQMEFGAGSSGSAVVGLYTDNGGAIGGLIVQSHPYPLSAGWVSFVLPPTSLAPGAYWLAGSFSGNAVYQFSAGAGGMNFESYAYDGSLPATVGATTGYGWDMCAQLNGCLLPTPTATPTRTAPPTPSATRTGTASPSASPTATASVTPTRTPCATGSATPSVSPTASGSATATASSTATGSPTPSATGTASPTGSPTLTATLTGTGTPTVSVSPTPTDSATPSVSATPSLSPTPSATATLSQSLTGWPTPCVTPTLMATARASATQTLTPWHSPSPTASPSPPSGPAVTATALAWGQGPVVVDGGEGVPDPDPRRLLLHLQGDVDGLWVKAYSDAMVLVGSIRTGAYRQGWAGVDMGGLGLERNGRYYLRVTPMRRGVLGQAFLVRVIVLR